MVDAELHCDREAARLQELRAGGIRTSAHGATRASLRQGREAAVFRDLRAGAIRTSADGATRASLRQGREAAVFRDLRAIAIRHPADRDLAQGLVERIGEHAVPAGPLAVRWLAYELDTPRAGVPGRARLRLENAGSAPWQSHGKEGLQLAYHWSDTLGNPIVWDGIRTPFPHAVEPGESVELDALVLAPRPPGEYRLAFDLVEEHRFWLQEVGSLPFELAVEVRPRIAERRLAVVIHGTADAELEAALAAQEEALVSEDAVAFAHLVPEALPAPDWSRRLLDGHEEGFAAVGGSIEPSTAAARAGGTTQARRVGSGRRPQPALLVTAPLPVAPRRSRPGRHDELPAYAGADALFEGRAVVRLRWRSGRPSD